MIDLIFYYSSEIVFVRITGRNIQFCNSAQVDRGMASIDGIKLNKAGVLKEFPDLEYRDDWREEAILRFKNRISLMKGEDEIAEYVIDDLKKYGYIPKFRQKAGFRKEVL